MKLNTYNHGYKITVTRPLTKGDIIAICKQLNEAFGEGNEFRPEPIGNGFLIWSAWPGKQGSACLGGAYKCMRLFACDGGRSGYHWPWVHDDVMEAWAGSTDSVVPPGKYITFLKSFRTAPKWLRSELQTIKDCLQEHGMSVGAIPTQKKLDFVE
jgi:hypothetical protein